MAKRTVEERFWAKVDKDGPLPEAGTLAFGRCPTIPCWVWTAALHNGYGIFWDGTKTPAGNDRTVPAHRFVYELLVAPIPEGLHIDHLCRVEACVNPDHLEPVTCRENLLRGETIYAAHASKTHCPKNHPFDEANTYLSKRGERKCRTCHREEEHARKWRTGERGPLKAARRRAAARQAD